MITFILFLTFLSAGIIQEVQVLLRSETHWLNSTAYTIGAIAFLFIEEPYISHAGILTLAMLAILKDINLKASEISYLKGVIHYKDLNDEDGIRQEEANNTIRIDRINRIDAFISLIVLIGLSIYTVLHVADAIIEISGS